MFLWSKTIVVLLLAKNFATIDDYYAAGVGADALTVEVVGRGLWVVDYRLSDTVYFYGLILESESGTGILAYKCRDIFNGGFGVLVGYGNLIAEGICALVVGRGPGYGYCTRLAVVLRNTTCEIVALNEELGVLAGIDACRTVAGAVEVVVEHVDLSDTCHRHTGTTLSAPHVVGEGGIEIARGLAVATSYEISVLVHVRTVGVAEGTPRNGVEVRLLCDVEVTIHSVCKSTMVYPTVLRTIEREQIAATDVDRTRSGERDVADNNIFTTLHIEDTRVTVCLTLVAGEVDDYLAGLILCLLAYTDAIGQCATGTAAGAHIGNARFIESIAYLICYIPSSAEACVIDADKGLVLDALQIDDTRYEEVAVRTIEDDNVVGVDGILDVGLHILTVGYEGSNLAVASACNRVGIASTAGYVVGSGSGARRNGAEAERLVKVIVCSHCRERQTEQCSQKM